MELTHKQKRYMTRALDTEIGRLTAIYGILTDLGEDSSSEVWQRLTERISDVQEIEAIIWNSE